MWCEERMQQYIKNNLKNTRYEHSLSVRATAIKLAQLYGVSIGKARIAGLVHDCAKNLQDKELLDIAKKHGYEIDTIYSNNPQLLHGIVGSIIAQEVMKIEDEDILNAIRYHTTGRKNMSLLEKIIYIADYIEPFRTFCGVNELRKIVSKDLDKALLKSFNNSIKFIIDQGNLIHMNTIEARNYLISQK